MPRGREAGHVDPDLGDDRPSGDPADSGDGVQALQGVSERVEQGLDPASTAAMSQVRGALAGRRDEAASGSFATATRVLAAYDALTTG